MRGEVRQELENVAGLKGSISEASVLGLFVTSRYLCYP
jgi:hypothetical protein